MKRVLLSLAALLLVLGLAAWLPWGLPDPKACIGVIDGADGLTYAVENTALTTSVYTLRQGALTGLHRELRLSAKNSFSINAVAQGADYYGFTLYDTRVLRDREGTKTEHMARAAKYLGGIHIPEEYTYISFGVQALYLSGGSLGCVYNDTIMAQAEELLALFLA